MKEALYFEKILMHEILIVETNDLAQYSLFFFLKKKTKNFEPREGN